MPASLPLAPAFRPSLVAAARPAELTPALDYVEAIKLPVHAPKWLSLLLFYAFWYVGNVMHNQYNTLAINSVGGKHGGLTMTIATMQLGVCTAYSLLLWLVRINPIRICGLQAPEKVELPELSTSDMINALPVGLSAAAAHIAGVVCLGADPIFGQIVKAAEPVLSVLVNTVLYSAPPTLQKALCLPAIVGGVAFASLARSAGGMNGSSPRVDACWWAVKP